MVVWVSIHSCVLRALNLSYALCLGNSRSVLLCLVFWLVLLSFADVSALEVVIM